jgi:hypothetical protein
MLTQTLSDIWEKVRRKWDYPRLNKPRLLTEEEAKEQGMADQIAAINMNSNEIIVNKANLEDRLGINFLPQIESHEVGHYKYMPFDLRNYVRLVGYADKVMKNMKNAQLVQNLYSDLCVNTMIYKKGDKEIIEMYKKLSKNNNSDLWNFYMATFENMTNCQSMIVPQAKKETIAQAKKISDILSESMGNSNKWPNSITEFAKAVKDYMKKEENNTNNNSNNSSNSNTNNNNNNNNNNGNNLNKNNPPYISPEKQIRKSMIDRHQAKDYLPFNPKKTPDDVAKKLIEKEVKGLGKELGINEFKRVMSGLGLGTHQEANKLFYRELSAEYRIFLPQRFNRSSGDFKDTPVKWDFEKSFSELDMEYTIRQSPLIIPGVTTYSWKTSSGEAQGLGNDYPDLLIVIDSSGSMPDPRENISYPILSAMAASETALSYGNKVAVINFSSDFESCYFSNQSSTIDDYLMLYLDEGTNIPGDQMVKFTSKNTQPTYSIIITDAEINNLESEIDNLSKALKYSKAGGTIFMCSSHNKKTNILKDIGYDIQFARNHEELGELTIKKSREIYNEKI